MSELQGDLLGRHFGDVAGYGLFLVPHEHKRPTVNAPRFIGTLPGSMGCQFLTDFGSGVMTSAPSLSCVLHGHEIQGILVG